MNWKSASVLGVMIWLVPFIVAFFFYKPDGSLSVPMDLFKSLMVVVSILVGTWALVRYFKGIEDNFAINGVLVGIFWMALNWGLDAIVLLPMSGMSVTDYRMQIGLRYIGMPIMAWGFGLALAHHTKSKR